MEDESNKGSREYQNGEKLQSEGHVSDSRQKGQQHIYLGCLTKQHLMIISVAVGFVALLIIIIVPAVLLPKKTDTSVPFPTDGDMLDFLVQTGDISKPDGLLATWFHRANSKEAMNQALAGDAMILEADVTLEGYGTPSVKPIPIMAHPPAIYSDNTLDQWLDAVLASRKGIKLDFKSLDSVSFSLDVLLTKNNSVGIDRPVWLNADIIRGPNTPSFVPPINGTRFLQLVQEKFPNVTLSLGWMVLYLPPIFTQTYSRRMMEDMYNMVKDVPQKVTFPIYTVLARSGWQHISWILSQSPRFSLTLWQDSIHPNISDLLFIRDNSQPDQVYYDIYEPTLSEFKEAVGQQGRMRRFYPGGDLMDFLYPVHTSDTNFRSTNTIRTSLAVRWFAVTNWTSLLTRISDFSGGMLVVRVGSDSNQPGVPLVEGSGEGVKALTLRNVLQLLGEKDDVPWGVYLRIPTQQLLEASLKLLQTAYHEEKAYRPVWISLDRLQSTADTTVFVSAVGSLFPHVTLVLPKPHWPPQIPAAVTALSQRVALHLNAASLLKQQEAFSSLINSYDLIVEGTKNSAGTIIKRLLARHAKRANNHLYVISD